MHRISKLMKKQRQLDAVVMGYAQCPDEFGLELALAAIPKILRLDVELKRLMGEVLPF